MNLNIKIPEIDRATTPRIAVIGIGGAGGNAVNNMIESGLEGVEFFAANTDVQALSASKAPAKIQLGTSLTSGLGAGSNAEVGKASAEEAAEEILARIDGAHMLFITAGMGGGTGTGAAPVIARLARERNILTVAVVTKPFNFEGVRRKRIAEAGLEELKPHTDTLIVIANENLFRVTTDQTPFVEAFLMADSILHGGVRGVTDLIVKPGLVNLDFADIRSVMSQMGQARIGSGEGEGEGRALVAAEAAIANPLLEETSMRGANGILINISGGEDMGLTEVQQAVSRVKEEVDPEAHIIFGSVIDPSLNGRIRVAMVATGVDADKRFHVPALDGEKEDMVDRTDAGDTVPVVDTHKRTNGWARRFGLGKLFRRTSGGDDAMGDKSQESIRPPTRTADSRVFDRPDHGPGNGRVDSRGDAQYSNGANGTHMRGMKNTNGVDYDGADYGGVDYGGADAVPVSAATGNGQESLNLDREEDRQPGFIPRSADSTHSRNGNGHENGMFAGDGEEEMTPKAATAAKEGPGLQDSDSKAIKTRGGNGKKLPRSESPTNPPPSTSSSPKSSSPDAGGNGLSAAGTNPAQRIQEVKEKMVALSLSTGRSVPKNGMSGSDPGSNGASAGDDDGTAMYDDPSRDDGESVPTVRAYDTHSARDSHDSHDSNDPGAMMSSAVAQQEQDDMLEIPAFLRRQSDGK